MLMSTVERETESDKPTPLVTKLCHCLRESLTIKRKVRLTRFFSLEINSGNKLMYITPLTSRVV